MKDRPGVLAVGNFDSDVGYAWRLMESLWCDLSDHMRNKGYSMYVCFPTISKIPECLTDHEFQVDQVDFTKPSLKHTFRQLSHIKRHSIRVLYLTDFKTASFRYALFRMAGVRKIVVHDHTPGLRSKPSWLKRAIKSVFNRLPLVSCSASFAVSPYVQRRLIDVNCVPDSKVYCVTNGIRFTPQVPATKPDSELVVIVTVARANYYKGIDFAIKVIKQLVDEGITNVRYVLYGDGPDLEAFKELSVKLGIEELVQFSGAVDDIPNRLPQCDIAFHPSKGEAMSLAILEYMRAELPVVASDNPSVSSALVHDQYALIYNEGNLKSATHALASLIRDSNLRKRLGTRGRKMIETEFSYAAMSHRFVSALKQVV